MVRFLGNSVGVATHSALNLFSALNLTYFIPFCFSSISSCILETLVTMGGLPLKGSSSTVATAESQPNQGSMITTSVPESKPKKKICCACPETKKLRDECIVEHGEESCAKWIEAHRKCLRAEGFNV